MQLDDAQYVSLMTFRKSGKEVATPVWFAGSDGEYYMFSAGDAGKVKRLRNSSRARVAPCDMRGKILGEWQQATAELLEKNSADEQLAYKALCNKYGMQMKILDLFSWMGRKKSKRAFIRVHLLKE